jgi:hypothetical protein
MLKNHPGNLYTALKAVGSGDDDSSTGQMWLVRSALACQDPKIRMAALDALGRVKESARAAWAAKGMNLWLIENLYAEAAEAKAARAMWAAYKLEAPAGLENDLPLVGIN